MAILALVALPLAQLAAADTATVKVADGFDYPVGKPNGHGYHKARGFTAYGHLGEDWMATAAATPISAIPFTARPMASWFLRRMCISAGAMS